MNRQPALHGKTLPVFFMQGYLDGLWHAVGKGNLITAYQLAAQEVVPDKTMRERWLTPLLAYFHHGTLDPQPLDYRFVALFQSGFQSQYMNAARVFTRRAGKEWWFGEPPISTYQDETGLQKHYASRILAAVNPRKFGAPGITTHTIQGYCELGILGVTTFLDLFLAESEIDFQVEADSTGITIEVFECPFCLHEHDLCYVFAGIVSGLLDWLHGHWGRERSAHQYLTLDDTASTNHRVVIDIRRYGLDSKLPANTPL